MKRKINTAKKGMVLIFTTIILFIATSVVAVLSTFVIVTRNQKIDAEYTARTQIVLKSKSYDIYQSYLLSKLVSLGKPSIGSSFKVSSADLTGVKDFTGTFDVYCYNDPYRANTGFYEYTIDYTNLITKPGDEKKFRSVGLVTRIDFSTTVSSVSASSFRIGEMRFF